MLQLIDEQLVAIELVASETIGNVAFRAVAGDREGGKVENGFACVPDHFTLALWWALQIVLLQMDGEWPPRELAVHQCAGHVFHVDLKITPVAAEGEQTLRLAEQRVQIVELVNLREDYTSSQVCARGIHLPVILITMPAWQILAYGGTNCEQVAQQAGANNLLHAQKAWVETKLVADHDDPGL